MMNKKGLSDIVTNVLIILLVLVAVSIVWFFVRGAIETGAEQIGGSSDCLTVDLAPIECVDVGGAACGGVAFGNACYGIKVKRNVGSGEIQDVRILIEGESTVDASGTSQGFSGLEELQAGTYGEVERSVGTDIVVSVAPIVTSGDGSKVCGESAKVTLTCG